MQEKPKISEEILTSIKGDFVWSEKDKKAIFEPNEKGRFVMAILK